MADPVSQIGGHIEIDNLSLLTVTWQWLLRYLKASGKRRCVKPNHESSVSCTVTNFGHRQIFFTSRSRFSWYPLSRVFSSFGIFCFSSRPHSSLDPEFRASLFGDGETLLQLLHGFLQPVLLLHTLSVGHVCKHEQVNNGEYFSGVLLFLLCAVSNFPLKFSFASFCLEIKNWKIENLKSCVFAPQLVCQMKYFYNSFLMLGLWLECFFLTFEHCFCQTFDLLLVHEL